MGEIESNASRHSAVGNLRQAFAQLQAHQLQADKLAAGLDTRAYRLAAPAAIPVFEVDLPENIEYKRAKLEKVYGRVPAHVTFARISLMGEPVIA